MKDLMIDLETLGTIPDCPVVSIGAVFFDLETKTLGDKFYLVLDIEEQMQCGRKPCGNTIKWWMNQSPEARQVFSAESWNAKIALGALAAFIATGSPRPWVWGNGSTFDISILESMYRHYGLPIPWGFNQAMDLRTFKRFVANNASMNKTGTVHNALDDAINQAQYVLENYK